MKDESKIFNIAAKIIEIVAKRNAIILCLFTCLLNFKIVNKSNNNLRSTLNNLM